jgi:hypothetical protein
MTMLGIIEVVFIALAEGIQIDSLLFVESREKQSILKDLRLVDTQFSYAGSQRAAVEPKDFRSPVFAAHLPIGLLKYPDDIVPLDLIQRFSGCC